MQTRSLFERRIANEWQLLLALSARNPGRMTDLRLQGSVLTMRLHGPVAFKVSAEGSACSISSHAVRVDFPVHFPAVPLEMFLQAPVVHPNIHPETGFVCLWDLHRVSNTVEHAMHKLAAMLAGQLQNANPMHVMQPLAVAKPIQTEPMPLLGVEYDPGPAATGTASPGGRRRRLQ